MEEDEIYRLFLTVMEHPSQNTTPVREVFSKLIKSTLKYRDQMLVSRGLTITVEDVRTVLGWLVPSLVSGQLPETDNRVRLDLLKIWLDDLRNLGNPETCLS
ncbi:MAG: hypothetical protein V1689_09740 [Pseudomonadota bacterium]